MNIIEESYKMHSSDFDSNLVEEEKINIANSWFDKSTADYWRHMRGYCILDGLNRDIG